MLPDRAIADDQCDLPMQPAAFGERAALPTPLRLCLQSNAEAPIHERDHRDQALGHQQPLKAAEVPLYAPGGIGRQRVATGGGREGVTQPRRERSPLR